MHYDNCLGFLGTIFWYMIGTREWSARVNDGSKHLTEEYSREWITVPNFGLFSGRWNWSCVYRIAREIDEDGHLDNLIRSGLSGRFFKNLLAGRGSTATFTLKHWKMTVEMGWICVFLVTLKAVRAQLLAEAWNRLCFIKLCGTECRAGRATVTHSHNRACPCCFDKLLKGVV